MEKRRSDTNEMRCDDHPFGPEGAIKKKIKPTTKIEGKITKKKADKNSSSEYKIENTHAQDETNRQKIH